MKSLIVEVTSFHIWTTSQWFHFSAMRYINSYLDFMSMLSWLVCFLLLCLLAGEGLLLELLPLTPHRRLCGAKQRRNSALIVIFFAMSLLSLDLVKSIDFNLLIQTILNADWKCLMMNRCRVREIRLRQMQCQTKDISFQSDQWLSAVLLKSLAVSEITM